MKTWPMLRCCALVFPFAMLAHVAHAAGGVVGAGTPASCTENAFDSVFSSAQATGGGRITFNCGSAPAVILFTNLKSVAADTVIDGGRLVTLSGGNATSLFQVFASAALTLDGITLTRGFGTYGAIESFGRLTVRNSIVTGNGATISGGGILAHSDLTVTNSTISDNVSRDRGGGIEIDGGTASIIDSQFTGNLSKTRVTLDAGGGGAISVVSGATASIANCNFIENSAVPANLGDGGAVRTERSLTIRDSTFRRNSANNGGALSVQGDVTSLVRVVFTNNSARSNGGAIYQLNGTLDASDVTLSGNSAAETGGAISKDNGVATVARATMNDNVARLGGGISHYDGAASFVNVTMTGNRAQTGGAVYAFRGTFDFQNATIADNVASVKVGGINAEQVSTPVTVIARNVILARNIESAGNKPTSCLRPFAVAQFTYADDATCFLGAGRDNVALPLEPLANNGGFTFTRMPSAGNVAIDGGGGAICPAIDQRGVARPAGLACDAGAVEILPGAPPISTAVEYFHAAFGHYFISYLPAEIAKLDDGTFQGWARTGQRFDVYQAAGANRVNVCRFFTLAFPPKSSHFYAPRGLGCEGTMQNPDWQFEGDVFATPQPAANGSCPSGHVPVYRLYNNGQGGAPNHRFTTSNDIRTAMLAAGYIAEGAGIGVGMCAPI